MDMIASWGEVGGFETPILVISWRRPKAVIQVIESLRRLAPSQLYLAGDGPRQGHEGDAGQGQISGSNFLDDQRFGDGNYFFGDFTTALVMATWRHSWPADEQLFISLYKKPLKNTKN
jgi:hypothetical protein